MKCLGIYGEKKKEEEKTFEVRITQDYDGSFIISCVDNNGEVLDGGYLARISKDGIRRYTSVNDEFGFRLNEDGQLSDI